MAVGLLAPEVPLDGLLVAPAVPPPLCVVPAPVPPVAGFAAVVPVDPDLTVVLLPAAVPAVGFDDCVPVALPPPVAFAF